MTASTPTHREDRDPSPTEVRKLPISRTESSEEIDEPWDERGAPKKRTSGGVMGLMEGAGEMMTDNLSCFAKTGEEGLEDGDLPSLSRPTSRPRAEQRVEVEDEPPSLLGSKRSTTRRPLNPPSEAGGMSVEERRLAAIRNRESPSTTGKRKDFFRQLDPPTPSDAEKTFDEGPDDEDEDASRRYMQPSYSEDIDSPQRRDEVVDEYESYGTLHNPSSVEDVSCFDTALTSITQICGYGDDDAKVSTRDKKWAEPHGDSWIDIDEKGDARNESAVEQTAIEVEYVAVEPEQEKPKEREGKPSASKKNSYLAALARKAKKDFDETSPDAKQEVAEKNGDAPGAVPLADGDDAKNKSVEDVYSSFNPMERRKFLKLINSGMSSKEACNKILAERDDGDKKKKKSLSLKKMFKRGKSEKGRENPKEEHPVGLAVDRSQKSGEPATPERDDVERPSPNSSFEGVSSGPSDTPPPSPRLQPSYSPKSSTSMDSADYDHGTPYASRSVPPPQDASADAYRAYNMAVASSPLAGTYDEDDGAVFVSSASESGDSVEDDQKEEKHNMAAATALGLGAAAAGTAAVIAATYSGESEGGSSAPFEKSGNNYYDAVRKEVHEQDEDDQEELGNDYGTRQTPKGSRMSSIRPSPRLLGFRSLKDNKKKQGEAERGAGEEAWEVAERSPKRLLRGVPTAAKGFEALENQRSGPLPQNTMSEDIEDEMRALEAEYDGPEAEEENLGKIERDLLRPGPASTVEDLLNDDDQHDTSYSLKTPRAMTETETSPTQRIEVAGDLSLENYFDSTASYASPGPPIHDQASVISGKSEWTARSGYTGGSTVHTQSSRKRHKGAAKKRIAKARAAEKAAESRKKGWHESIVAAAASTNRVWDPQKGWVDYEDPDAIVPEAKSTEKLRVSLDGVTMRSGDAGRGADERSSSRSVDVPFPSDWERERDEMTQSGHVSPQSAGGVNAYRKPNSPMHREGSNATADEWVESMREATAGVERDGQIWDPEVGWVSVENDISERQLTEERSRIDPNDQGEDIETRGMQPKGSESTNNNRDALETFIEKSAVPIARRSELSTGDSDQAVASSGGTMGKKSPPESVGSSAAFAKDQSSASVANSKDSISETQPNKYVQLGDNGSVRSSLAQEQQRLKSQQEQQQKVAEINRGSSSDLPADAAFFAAAPMFPGGSDEGGEKSSLQQAEKDSSYSTGIRRAPQVNVVKQKCDEDDLNLFSDDDFGEVGNFSHRHIKTPPKKDRSGPIDLDDLDDNIDAVNTESTDSEDVFRQDERFASPKMLVSPAVPEKPGTPTDSSHSLSRPIKATTPVPKLGRNKRDTSPINGRTAEAKQSQSRHVATFPAPTNEADSESHLSPGGDESVTSSVKERLQQWETRSGSKSSRRPDPPSQESRKSRPEGNYESKARSITPEVEPESVAWPEVSGDPSELEGQNVPAEWKSFFGKKVRAESSAAMQAQSQVGDSRRPKYVSADAMDEYHRPDDGSFPRKGAGSSARWTDKDDDDDSLFEFEKTGKDDRRGNRAAPRDFPDISPIHTRDEDEIVMEEVESNTGAVNKDSTFLQRLSTCAAPMMPAQLTKACDGGASVPMSAFLRSPSSRNGTLAEEVITEENEDGSKSRTSRSSRGKRGSPRESSRAIGSEVRSSSSVASEDFGQKTAYLEAIAMKAAVSNPKRSGSSSRRRSPGSDISSTSRSSEKWKAFLEKKKAAGGESSSKSNTDVSKAAEKYAAEKVDEMLSVMSSRSRSAPKSRDGESSSDAKRRGITSSASGSSRQPYEMQRGRSDGERSAGSSGRKSEAQKAAEELASARVEAMMEAMSSKSLDEGEI